MSKEHFVLATMWEYIKPIERGERYEDPLDANLKQAGIGEVTGGGTQLSDMCGIEYVDIDITLSDLERGIPLIVESLNSSGAPKGSVLKFQRGDADETVEFGISECLAIFLDGNSLPDEVYQKTDVNELNDRLQSGGVGELGSWWAGPSETVLFYFGLNAESQFNAIKPVLESYPLCQNSRVVIRHGNSSLNSRTVQFPRHT